LTPLGLARAAPFRHAIVFAAFACAVMGVLFAVILWAVTDVLGRHLDEAIDTQLEVLRSVLERDGRGSVIGLVRAHRRDQDDSPLHYLLLDGGGTVLAGDLPAMDPVEGWHDIELASDGATGDGPQVLRGHGVWLAEDLFALVTNDKRDLAATRDLLLRSFAVALAVTVALALGGGIFIGTLLLRRVDDVNRIAGAIMEGDLSQRIPESGVPDGLEGLIEALNRMLARIEELMANLRHVTSDIAHDLRTPLGRLRHRLEAVRDSIGEEPEAAARVDAALGEVDTLLRTFEAMLRIAEVEAGARRARFTAVNLGAVADNVCDAFAAVAEDEGKSLHSRITTGLTIEGDQELLTQMIANLIENAIRHTPAGTRIEVVLARAGAGVRLLVQDTGPGIPVEERDRVFGRFYRMDRSRPSPGSGLGLSLVAAIARLHGARVSLGGGCPAGLSVAIEFAAAAPAPGNEHASRRARTVRAATEPSPQQR